VTILVAWHTLSVEETAQRLGTDAVHGLTRAEVARRYAQDGPNVLPAVKARSGLSILLRQFRSLIVALALGEGVEAVAILVVIVLNAVIGFLTEWKAEAALDALRKQTVAVAHVVRDTQERQIPAEELVAGDVVILNAGDRVPADGRIVESVRRQLEEAALTGESLPVAETHALLGADRRLFPDPSRGRRAVQAGPAAIRPYGRIAHARSRLPSDRPAHPKARARSCAGRPRARPRSGSGCRRR